MLIRAICGDGVSDYQVVSTESGNGFVGRSDKKRTAFLFLDEQDEEVIESEQKVPESGRFITWGSELACEVLYRTPCRG